MPNKLFKNTAELRVLVEEYFKRIEGEYEQVEKPSKKPTNPLQSKK